MQRWSQSDGFREEDVILLLIINVYIEFLNNPYFTDASKWKVAYDDKFNPITN
jgi:hypothetical protein